MRDFELESEGQANMLLLNIEGVGKCKGFGKATLEDSDTKIISGGVAQELDDFVNHSIPHYIVVDREGTVVTNYDNFHYVQVPIIDDE